MKLVCFGYGYSARRLTRLLCSGGDGDWTIIGTHRDPDSKPADDGAVLRPFTRGVPLSSRDLAGTTHVLISTPPDENGDPVLSEHGPALAASASLCWLGYLSTTGVYGDRGGAWVDESSPCLPSGRRGAKRLAAENGWLGLWCEHQAPVHIFRLPGIYGPGRSALDSVRGGRARRVVKPGQVFSRIHVEDIAAGLSASIRRPRPGAVYNLCDNEPAPPQDVILHACRLLGVTPPPEVPFEQAGLSEMAVSFYRDNKRVRNALMRRELGFSPAYGDYRSGLRAILAEEKTANG